jgi:Acyclic terpene utilisation family protein AtuA
MTTTSKAARKIRIGAGAGYSGDRIEPAVELAQEGDLAYLVFECLAERTIALAQQAKMIDPRAGYDPLLAARMHAVLPSCRARNIKIVTNMGAANPLAAAEATCGIARGLGLAGLKVAAVTGDDVLEAAKAQDVGLDEGGTIAKFANRLLSANAYLGAGPVAAALAQGADV